MRGKLKLGTPGEGCENKWNLFQLSTMNFMGTYYKNITKKSANNDWLSLKSNNLS